MKPKTQTYKGRCHCGGVRFEFKSPPITSGVRCNCSFCIRKAAVMSPQYVQQFVTLKRETLGTYQFGEKSVMHYFCKRCGHATFHQIVAQPGHYRVNLGCVAGINPLDLPIEIIDGASF